MSGDNTAEVATEQPHSVELSTNAKGVIQPKVKAYGETPEKAVENAFDMLDQVSIELATRAVQAARD